MLRTNNCRANDANWRTDDGVVTDQDLLPVTKYWYGDTGGGSEDTRIVLKPLVCTNKATIKDTSAATCAQAYRNGHRANGHYMLKNNLGVLCNFDDLDNIRSALKITSSNTGTLTGHENPCGKQYNGFSYNGNTAHMAAYVTAVKAAGGSCEQNFDFHCRGSGWTSAAYGSEYHCASAATTRARPPSASPPLPRAPCSVPTTAGPTTAIGARTTVWSLTWISSP